jgi:hypothetical protein
LYKLSHLRVNNLPGQTESVLVLKNSPGTEQGLIQFGK